MLTSTCSDPPITRGNYWLQSTAVYLSLVVPARDLFECVVIGRLYSPSSYPGLGSPGSRRNGHCEVESLASTPGLKRAFGKEERSGSKVEGWSYRRGVWFEVG